MLDRRLEIDSPSRGRKPVPCVASERGSLGLEIDSPSRGRKHKNRMLKLADLHGLEIDSPSRGRKLLILLLDV